METIEGRLDKNDEYLYNLECSSKNNTAEKRNSNREGNLSTADKNRIFERIDQLEATVHQNKMDNIKRNKQK